MAIPVWPAINSKARFDGFSVGLSDGANLAATDMDSGEARYRRRFTTTLAPVAMSIELTTEEVAIFKQFWKIEIRQGSFWFYMPVFTGVAYSTCLVRIDKENQPKITPLGYDNYELSLSLLVRDMP
jgi:hypothetical protein